MMTYLTVWFNSEGAPPMEVVQRLKKLGFTEQQGNYDFSYKWHRKPQVEELLRMADLVQKALEGTKTSFNMETI